MILKDVFLTKLRYFYGTDKEWVNLIEWVRKNKKEMIIVCDPHPNLKNYPKNIKVIRSINTAKRTLSLRNSIVFLSFADKNIYTAMSTYFLLQDSPKFYCYIEKRDVLNKIVTGSIKIKVFDKKRYIK